jgi:23S rRNA pseudouridine1911/1915/1917 synthase
LINKIQLFNNGGIVLNQESIYTFIIEDKDTGVRMDTILAKLMEESSRNSIQKLIEQGNVSVNGQVVTIKKFKLTEGDFVKVIMKEPSVFEVVPENISIEIVYEDEDIIVVNKPKNMVVHPAVGNSSGTLVNGLLYHCNNQLSSINGPIRPGIVHRIDKDTSGLLMIAKNDDAHRTLAEQLSSHIINRVYRAVVYNNFLEDVGKIEAPIGRDPNNRLRMAVVPNGKKAITHYRVLERFGKFTYIEVKLETGRTHQIRVHMAYIKHPLLGDGLYGPKKSTLGVKTQILHAKTLGFTHPKTGEYMEFDSLLPVEFETVLEKLRNFN